MKERKKVIIHVEQKLYNILKQIKSFLACVNKKKERKRLNMHHSNRKSDFNSSQDLFFKSSAAAK